MSQIELIPLSLHELASSPVFLIGVKGLAISPLNRTFLSCAPLSNDSPEPVGPSHK